MKYVGICEFPVGEHRLTEEQKMEEAKERLGIELAKYLLQNATCEMRENGSVRITVDI